MTLVGSRSPTYISDEEWQDAEKLTIYFQEFSPWIDLRSIHAENSRNSSAKCDEKMERHVDPKHQMRECSVILPVENSRGWLHWKECGREDERSHIAKLVFNAVAAMKRGVLNQQSRNSIEMAILAI
jgi:hypothetical protein